MHYLGGKRYLAPALVDAMASDLERATHYVEPFLGAANVACEVLRRYPLPALLLDAHPDLILLWRAATSGWRPPRAISEAEYAALKRAEPSALRGFVGFGCSFSGKWFGGYARNGEHDYVRGASNQVVAKASELLRATIIARASYAEIPPEDTEGCVIYCDPPYAGTIGYKGTPPFDHAAFWQWADACARYATAVYVSEFTAPSDWPVVWSKARTTAVDGAGSHRERTEILVRKGLT